MTPVAIIDNKITVQNPTDDMRRWAEHRLVLNNPDYYKKLKMGKWTGNTPDKIWLFENIGGNLCIPFGCIRSFYARFRDICNFRIAMHDMEQVEYVSNIDLYDYQRIACDQALKVRNGVIVMPCGSGKTQTALEVVSRVRGRCLWLTHTSDLLNQSMNRAKAVLDTSASYGKITGGKIDIGEGITFATVQTMAKIDLVQYKDVWDIIIVDECHHACGSPTRVTQFYKVISSLSARYKIGLTATPKRADGLEKSMFALLGGIIHEVSKEEVASTTCPIRVCTIETGYSPDYDVVLMGDGTIDYMRLLENLTTNEDRLNLLAEIIGHLDGACIVLASRVAYLQELWNRVIGKKGLCLSGTGTSKRAKEVRKRALQSLNDGELDVIYATYQLSKEGLDVPNLRYIVLATPEKDETTVTQSVGRVGRKAEGKTCGVVIDCIDDFGMYRGWAKKRKGYYKKLGISIDI